jgi:hypothetical protein
MLVALLAPVRLRAQFDERSIAQLRSQLIGEWILLRDPEAVDAKDSVVYRFRADGTYEIIRHRLVETMQGNGLQGRVFGAGAFAVRAPSSSKLASDPFPTLCLQPAGTAKVLCGPLHSSATEFVQQHVFGNPKFPDASEVIAWRPYEEPDMLSRVLYRLRANPRRPP